MFVLLTGFEPYGDENFNPSGEIAKRFDGKVINGVKIVGTVVPVSFKRVKPILEEKILEVNPSLVISLGLAPRTHYIRIERVAINVMDSGPDNDGYAPRDEPIVAGGPTAYFSTLPIRGILKRLISSGIPAAISNSAGTYLCNCVMYLVQHIIRVNEVKAKAGFIHIPYTAKQSAEKLQSTLRGVPPPFIPLTLVERSIELAVSESLL